MRGIRLSTNSIAQYCRSHSAYGLEPLRREEFLHRFGSKAPSATGELELLERTEEQISRWRLNKWEFRVPPLLSGSEKEKAQLQRDVLKSLCIARSKEIDAINKDVSFVASVTGISPTVVREKNRAWLQDETAKLRWKGEINNAKELRDAFFRLEVYGSRDHRLLERLCCMYGMGLQRCYEDAFSNIIVEDPLSKKRSVDTHNCFSELLSCLAMRYPHIDIIYSFLGFDAAGYRLSLRKFLTDILEKKSGSEGKVQDGRVAFASGSKEILFDFNDSRSRAESDEFAYGLPDFLYIRDSDFFLITIASDNHWFRTRQVPHAKQLEGIARRGSFVLGVPLEKARIRNILLPPSYVDKESLLRLLDIVIGIDGEEQKKLIPWLSLYDKQLDAADIDFCDLSKSVNEEEWLTL